MSEILYEVKAEIKSNSLQMEQLSEDVRGLMYAVRDLTEQLALKEES